MTRFVLLVAVAACSPCLLLCQGAPPVDAPALRLTLSAARETNVAEPFAMKLSLANKTNQPIVLPSLRSALITIVVKQTPEGEKWSAAHGGPVAEVRKRVGNVEMTRFERVKAETVQLVPGQESDWGFDLAETFGIRLFPGDYTIDVQYENRATAEAQVHAKVNEATTVPALINLIESGDPETKVWARNSLFILTGYPEWEIRTGDTEMQLKERLKDLRTWWSVNQPHLKLEGTKLVPK